MAARDMQTAQEKAGFAALVARAQAAVGGVSRGLPPIERWNPPFCGEIDMEIRADGAWFYLGTPINRPALVRLFSTILRKDEDGRTYLVTPVEKLAVRVADAPFLAVEMSAHEKYGVRVLTFRTQTGDVVEAGPEHPLRFDLQGGNHAFKPYLRVRGRLEALLSRAVTHELAALGETEIVDGVAMFCVRSAGATFPIMPAEELDALSQ